MTEEQRREYFEFEEKQKLLKEEFEKHKKQLELELKKLRTEVNDSIKSFDISVQQLSERRNKVQLAITSQELYITTITNNLSVNEKELNNIKIYRNKLKLIKESTIIKLKHKLSQLKSQVINK